MVGGKKSTYLGQNKTRPYGEFYFYTMEVGRVELPSEFFPAKNLYKRSPAEAGRFVRDRCRSSHRASELPSSVYDPSDLPHERWEADAGCHKDGRENLLTLLQVQVAQQTH